MTPTERRAALALARCRFAPAEVEIVKAFTDAGPVSQAADPR